MSIPMITTTMHRYGGKWLKVGDPFDALTTTDADELRLLGFAEIDKSKAAQTYETRVMTAVDPMTTTSDEAIVPPQSGERPKRKYNRRDLKAR